MTRELNGDRLWDLPRVERDDDRPAPPDAHLLAYRAGRMSPGEATRIEWHLAGSRTGRERLASLAGIRIETRPARRSRRMPIAAALLATAAAAGIVALLVAGRGRLPGLEGRPVPEFSVRAEGLAPVRGAAGEARAYASERVRVVVEPLGEAVPGLTFTAYRLDDGGLTRLEEPAEIAVTVDRGSASIAAEAARLIGPAEGTRPFFIVVSHRAGLPGRVPAPGGAAESALAEATGGRVYRVPLTIVPPTENAP